MKIRLHAYLPTLLGVGLAVAAGSASGKSLTVASTDPARNAAALDDQRDLKTKYRRAPLRTAAPSAAHVELGRTLFFDPRLSRASCMSCATCHNPGFSWGDGLPRAVGHGMKTLGRRTPTVLNIGWAEAFFWDGRAETLEQQALGPIAAAGEMNLPHGEMIKRLENIAGYKPLFSAAFGDTNVTKEKVAIAIADFERTIVSTDAPFDRWLAGEKAAIPTSAKRGFALFNGKADCAKCHAGWRFTDDSFHDIGALGDDVGRATLLPGLESMDHAFKTPTLRDVALRAPYMHDGSEGTLEQVIELYDKGGRVRRPGLATEVHPLQLTAQDKRDLVDFMLTLSSPPKSVAVPSLPR
ncbi:MAG TPA: cytochrome c peroxidase [Polyangia bacterium]|jgi:cytochrome c peroxidase|nr:cytochrome c peroxidase [Polyangia bacterium]